MSWVRVLALVLISLLAGAGCRGRARDPGAASAANTIELLDLAARDPALVDSVGTVAVDGVLELGLVARADQSHAIRVKVPPASELRFDYGIAERDWTHASTSVEYSVVLDAGDGKPRPLWTAVIRPWIPSGRAWRERVIPLAEFAGTDVTLRFNTRVIPPPGGVPPSIAEPVDGFPAWGRLRIVPDETNPQPDRPDVLLVLSSNTGLAQTGLPGGGTTGVTPVIEDLARGGTTFTHAFSQSSQVGASLVSLMTSLYPLVTGAPQSELRLRTEIPTLATWLGAAGYETALYTVFGPSQMPRDLYRGFRRVDESQDHYKLAQGAGEMLGAPHRKPLFLVIVLNPHVYPYPLDPVFAPRFGWADDLPQPDPSPWPAGPPPTEAAEFFRRGHQTQVASADHLLGALLDHVDEAGNSGRTLVIATAPRGVALGAAGRFGEGTSLSDTDVRIPLVMRLPGTIPSGMVHPGVVELVDLAPTVLSAVGLDLPAGVQGRDLLPTLRGEVGDGPGGGAISEILGGGARVRTLRTASRRYYRWLDDGRESLFDTEKDPDEAVDLFSDPRVREGLAPLFREQMDARYNGRSALGRYQLAVELAGDPAGETRVRIAGRGVIGFLSMVPPLDAGELTVDLGGTWELKLAPGAGTRRLRLLCREDEGAVDVFVEHKGNPVPPGQVILGGGGARAPSDPVKVSPVDATLLSDADPPPLPEGARARIWIRKDLGGGGPSGGTNWGERLRALGYVERR